jgi:hypothetical protein
MTGAPGNNTGAPADNYDTRGEMTPMFDRWSPPPWERKSEQDDEERPEEENDDSPGEKEEEK